MRESFRRFLMAWAPVFRGLAGGVLTVAGYAKAVRPPAEFAAVLETYWVLPVSVVMPLARTIPWVELLTGLALLTGFFTRSAAWIGAGLFALFLGFLGQSLLRGLDLKSCGCFGAWGPALTPRQTLAWDTLWWALCVGVGMDREKRWTLDRWMARP